MPRVTHIKRAQQRYATKPVLDPETGQQKTTPMMKNGKQQTTKHGKPVVLRLTERDYSRPLPMPKCGKCGVEIAVGQPYKHMSPKSGPYGGRTLVRCAVCPTWQYWEYSNSNAAQVARIQNDFEGELDGLGDFETVEDVQGVLENLANALRDFAAEKQDAADNIESGFGHETEQSSNLANFAEELESYADEVESTDLPDLPDPEETDCEACEGTGTSADQSGDDPAQCEECGGTGRVTPDEPTDEQMIDWRDEVLDAAREAGANIPEFQG